MCLSLQGPKVTCGELRVYCLRYEAETGLWDKEFETSVYYSLMHYVQRESLRPLKNRCQAINTAPIIVSTESHIASPFFSSTTLNEGHDDGALERHLIMTTKKMHLKITSIDNILKAVCVIKD